MLVGGIGGSRSAVPAQGWMVDLILMQFGDKRGRILQGLGQSYIVSSAPPKRMDDS